MNLQEDILNVLKEGLGKPRKQDVELKKLHKVQVVDDPEKQDPKVASGAPKPKVPKGQGAKGVKIDDVEEYDGKKVDPKKEDDIKQARAKQPKGKGLKGFKESLEEGQLDELKSREEYSALIKKHMDAAKGQTGNKLQHHKKMIIKYRRAMMKASQGGSAPKASGEDEKEVERKRLASIRKALAKESAGENFEQELTEFMNRLKPDDIRDRYGVIVLTYRNSADLRTAASTLQSAGVQTRRGSKDGTLEVDSNSKLFKDKGIHKAMDGSKRIRALHSILDEDSLDPVNKKAASKDFKDRKDKDIDNDGDVDSSDKYLHKRRKAISKATNEAVNPAKFVKGGDFKVKKNDVDSLLSKLFGNQKLSKEIEKNKAYKAGYKGGKNPYKKDTADFHLFILGQQAKSAE